MAIASRIVARYTSYYKARPILTTMITNAVRVPTPVATTLLLIGTRFLVALQIQLRK